MGDVRGQFPSESDSPIPGVVGRGGDGDQLFPANLADVLDRVGRDRELNQDAVRALLASGLLTQLVLLEPPGDQVVDKPRAGVDRADKIQDLLVKLLEGQIVIRRRVGQSEQDAIREARAELTQMLTDLKSERQNHVIGPATEAAFKRFQELYSQRALSPMRGLTLTLREALTDAGLEKFNQQGEAYKEVRRRANERQDQLISFLPAYIQVERRKGEKQEDYLTRRRTEAEKKTGELRLEREQGVWGPRSQEAYKQYQKWFNEMALPGTMGGLDSLALRWPVNCPERLRMGMAQRAEHPEIFRALYAAGRRIRQDNSDPTHALEDDAYVLFGRNNKWLQDATELISSASATARNEELKKIIVEEKLPAGWLVGADEDPKRWRARAAEMIDLVTRVGNLLEAMDHLNRGSKDQSFPFIPPPGTEFERNPDGSIARNPDGTIKKYKLRVPQDLIDNQSNYEIAQALRNWVAAHQDRIVEGVMAYRGGLANPERLLSFTNLEMHGKLARINDKGEFVGIANPNEPLRDGETRRSFNLIECRCHVEVAREGPNKGKQVIVQTIEARDIPRFGYQNWVGPTVAAMPRQEIPLDRTKFYAVLNGDKIELVRGDKLPTVLGRQQAWLRAEQTITPVVDAALIALTFGKGFAAVRAARATDAALRLTAAECRRELVAGGLRLTMVGAGILNSAGGRDTEFGRFANHARGIYFLCDIGLGLSRQAGWLSVPESVRKMQAAVDSSRWLWTLHSGTKSTSPTDRVFKVSECCFVPFILRDLRHLGERALGSNRKNLLRDASLILGDGVSFRPPERDSFDMRKPEILKQEREMLSRYITMLGEGRGSGTQENVRRILNKTQELLDPNANSEEREKFKKELLEYFLLDRRTMESLIKRLGMKDTDLRELHDPALLMRKWTENGVAAEVEKRNNAVGPDVRAAAAIALLTLSRQPDGSIPSELVSEGRTYTVRGGRGGTSARSYTVGISPQELFGYLQRDMALPDQHSRGIMTGEVLVRHGAMTGQRYAGTLLSVLEDPNSTREDRMRALTDSFGPRFATIVDGLRGLEEVGSFDLGSSPGRGFGLSAKALQDALRKRAREDPDADVRAMAAMLLYGLNHQDRKAGEAILQENNARWQALEDKEKGSYAREVKQYLESQCAAEIPPPAAPGADERTAGEANTNADIARANRLNAALQLWELSDKSNQDEQRRLARIMASCWSVTDADVSVKVIEALWPDRIKLLDGEEVAALQRKAVDLLSVPAVARGNLEGTVVVGPQAEKQAAAMVRLIRQIPQVIGDQNPELSRLFCTKLEQMIDPREVSPRPIDPRIYETIKHTIKPAGALPEATLFPELRAEAMRALAFGQGAQSSIPLLRARLTGEVSFGGQRFPGEVDTSDAQSRIEAARGLVRLQDRTWLCEHLPELIRKEVDPAVAQVLRDLQADFPSVRVPDRVQLAQNRYEAAVRDYQRPKPPDENVGKNYLKDEKYKLLDGGEYRAAVEQAHDSIGDAPRPFRGVYEGVVGILRLEAVKKKYDERERQWNALITMARKSDRDTDGEAGKAKAALSWILLKEGLSEDFCISPSKDDKRTIPGAGPLSGFGNAWRQRAARALVDVLVNGEEKQKTVFVIEKALKDGSVDAETKRILLQGLRWQFEQSNKLIEELGPGSGQSKQHQERLGFDRAHLATTLGQILEVEREKANQVTGVERMQRNRLRMELLTDFVRYGNRDELYPILLASALHDPVQPVKDFARQKLYETRDGIDAAWNAIPANRNPKVEDGVTRVISAYETWKRSRTDWMRYMEEFKRNPEGAPWRPEVADKRDALVNAIFTGFKGCKFDGTNRQGEAQALELLSVLMDDPDGKIRLAAARILSESPVTIADPVKRKSLAVYCDILSKSDNPEYKREAATQLAKFRLDKPTREYIDLFSQLELDELRKVAQLLTAVSTHHQDDATKRKAAEIAEQLWQNCCRDITDGRRTVTGGALKPDDPLVPLLEKTLRNTGLTESQRLNAGRILIAPENEELKESDRKANAAVYAQVGLTSSSSTTRLEVATDILRRERTNLFSQGDCTQALRTLIDLAAHDQNTRASALLVLLADEESALRALKQINQNFDAQRRTESVDKLQAELALMLLLYKECQGNPTAESCLYKGYVHAQKHLDDDNTVTKQILSLLDRSSGESEHSKIESDNDPRIQPMRLALRNGNPDFRYCAALALTETSTEGIDAEVRTEARGVIFDRIKRLTAEARQLELTSQDRNAIGQSWAKVEQIFNRIDPEGRERERSYSYHYARMRRMVSELGTDMHKDLAPVYLKLADLIEAAQDQRQADLYRQKARECSGDTENDTRRDELAALRDRFAAAQRLSQSASQSQAPDELARAENELKQLAVAFRNKLGENSKEVADVMGQLGSQYMAQGRTVDGEAVYRVAVEIYERLGKAKMPGQAARSLLGLSRYYASTGNWAGYEECKGKMLDMSRIAGRREVQLDSTQAILDLADYLASDASTQQMSLDAQQLMQHALDVRKKVAGADSVEVADAAMSLAQFYANPRNPLVNGPMAERHLTDSLRVYSMRLGTNNEKWAIAQARLADMYVKSGRWQESLDAYGAALDAMHNSTTVDVNKYREMAFAYRDTIMHYKGYQEAQMFDQLGPRAYRSYHNMQRPQPASQPP